MHSAGIQAMGVLMDRIMARLYKAEDRKNEARIALERIAPHCCWTEGTWEGLGLKWNDIESTPRQIKALADHLLQLDFAAAQEAA